MASTQQVQENKIVVQFQAGTTASYDVASDSVIHFPFDVSSIFFEQRGDDLILTNANGDSVELKGYMAFANADTPLQVVLLDDVVVASDTFLFSVADAIEPAADGAPAGGGLNPLAADPGDLLGGVGDAADSSPRGAGEGPQADVQMASAPDYFPEVNELAEPTEPTEPVEPPVVVEEYEFPTVAESTVDFHPGPGEGPTMFSFPGGWSPHTLVTDADDPRGWVIRGDVESELISGGANQDFLSGFDGNDTIYGNGGNDGLSGQVGDDVLYGGSGSDILNGGVGADSIYGGGGYDTIALSSDDIREHWYEDITIDNPDGAHDVIYFDASTFSEGSAIVQVNDFVIGEDGISLLDGVTIEGLRESTFDYDSNPATPEIASVDIALSNGTDDNVIVRLLGTTKLEFEAQIDSLGDSYAYSDTEQLLQYMAGSEANWV